MTVQFNNTGDARPK